MAQQAIRLTYKIRVEWSKTDKYKELEAWVEVLPGYQESDIRNFAFGQVSAGEPGGGRVVSFNLREG